MASIVTGSTASLSDPTPATSRRIGDVSSNRALRCVLTYDRPCAAPWIPRHEFDASVSKVLFSSVVAASASPASSPSSTRAASA